MAGAVESLLSMAGIGPARTATSSSLARSTSVAVVETRRTTATVAATTTSTTARTSAVVTTASVAKSTMGPVQVTTARSSSSIEKTTMRSTSIPLTTSTTRLSSTSISSSARSTQKVSVTTLTSTSTPSSASSSSTSASVARSTTLDDVGVPPASATASAGQAEEGFKMSSGIIAAIVIASLLAVLALALVGYRYYKRHARKNSRRISGLSAWAGQGGWEGEDRYGKHEEDGGVGRWEGTEKERVSPFPVNAGASQPLTYEQGYDNGYHQSGYPPQPQYAPQQAYDTYQAQQPHAQPAPYQEINKNLPLPPQPVSMGMAQPQAGWMPGTPHTFGSFASTDGVDPESATAMPRDDPLAAARATGLKDGSEVVVKQGFVRSLDDELVIVVGEKLTLVQAYDDGWSLCEKIGWDGMLERGVVPLNCLEVFSGKTMAEESVSMPQPAVVGHIGKPEETSPVAGQEFLAMPSPSKAGKMTRSSTAHSLAVSERSERRSSLFLNAAAAGLWLQTQPPGAARP